MSQQASDINLEAGSHIVPQDPMEIVLALRAGKMAWEAFPYLQMRSGERGMRFTGSDRCWLLSLTKMPADAATKNLNWLRRVLAPRGIPTIILTQHLRQIATLLNDAHAVQSPCRSESYTAFRDNVNLEQRSVAQNLDKFILEFNRKLASHNDPHVPAAAELIASAWLDERVGITGAFEATKCWFVSPVRFSADWIELVEGFIAELENTWLEKRVRCCQGYRATSWRVDETYVKVGGEWKYPFRAIDKHGRLIDFHVGRSPQRSGTPSLSR